MKTFSQRQLKIFVTELNKERTKGRAKAWANVRAKRREKNPRSSCLVLFLCILAFLFSAFPVMAMPPGGGTPIGPGSPAGHDYFPNQNANYKPANFTISYKEYTELVPDLNPGEKFKLKLRLKLISAIPAGKQVKSVQLVTSTDAAKFPFVIEKNQYYSEVSDLGSGDYEAEQFGTLKVKKNASPGSYTLLYLVTYGKKDGAGNWSDVETSQEISYINILPGSPSDPGAPDDDDEKDEEPEKEEERPENVLIQVKQGTVPRAKKGDLVPIRIPLINRGDDIARIITVTPVISVDTTTFPFELTQSDYTVKVGALLYPSGLMGIPSFENGSYIIVDYGTMQVREDVKTQYYKVDFVIKYQIKDKEYQETTQSLYFHLTGDEEKEKDDEKDQKIPVPRVLNKGFRTKPEKVMGGMAFTLTVKLCNQSKITDVKNVRVNFSSEGEKKAFLPTEGASSRFIDLIPAGATHEVSMDFNCMQTIAAGIYGISMDLEYEDYKNNPYESHETISIPVIQDDRIDFSKATVQPPSISVGDDANVVFSIYNKGKTTLSNVTVTVPKGTAVSGQDAFPGNMDPGTAAEVDMMLHAEMANPEDKPIKLLITYEDGMGKEQKIEKEITINILDGQGGMPGMPGMPGDMPPDGGGVIFDEEGNPIELGPDGEPLDASAGKKFPVWGWALIALVCISLLILIINIVKKRRERKYLMEDDDELLI